jgi:predicted RNase H-like HicB family nuclease
MPSSHRALFSYDGVDDVWLVDFPAHPGCHTYGETLDEARVNALEALQLHLDRDDVAIEAEGCPGSGWPVEPHQS